MKTSKKCEIMMKHDSKCQNKADSVLSVHPSGPSVRAIIYGAGVSSPVPDEVWYEAMEQSE